MRNLLPIITVALSGCFYIGAQDERDRLALLDSDPVDTDTNDTDPIDTDVALELDVWSVLPSLIVECDGAATLQVTSRVNEEFELTSFTVFARVDDGQDVPIGQVDSTAGIAGYANLNFPVPINVADLATLGSCGAASCHHELFVSVKAPSGEEALSQGFPIDVVGDWSAPPVAVTSVQAVDETLTDLASPDFLDAIASNPAGGVSSETYPKLNIALSHPWFDAVDGAGDWDFTVLACPEGIDPSDASRCTSVTPSVAWVDGELELTIATAGLAARACDAPSAPWEDFYLTIEGDACLGNTTIALEDRDFRFVVDDCDGDGLSAATDCDDADPARAPDQVDLCDGVDGNCDTVIDVEINRWKDADGDHHGDQSVVGTLECPSKHPSYVNVGDDCDDLKSDVFPGAAETCNGTDNNCSGSESDAPQATDGYKDADLDGYGVAPAIHDCLAVHTAANHATKLGDCNDGNAEIYPLHAETCADLGIDNNCDLDVTDANNPTAWHPDDDKDGYGGTTVSLACIAPAGFIADSKDCDDADPTVNPLATEVCDSVPVDENCDGTTATACAVGDECLDDLACSTGACGTSGLCEPWTLWSSGVGDESFSEVTVTADGRRILAFRSNSPALSLGGKSVPGTNANLDWVIVRTDETGAVTSTSRVKSPGTDTPSVIVAEPLTGRYAVGGTINLNGSPALLDGVQVMAASAGSGHPAVMVFNANDSPNWAWQTFDISDGAVVGATFATNGDLFVGGLVDRVGSSDIFVARLKEDPASPGDGLQVWFRKYAGTAGDDFIGGVASAPGGDIVISGGFGGGAAAPATLNLGNGCSLNADDTAGDGFIARLDGTDGRCRWAVALHQNSGFQFFDDVVVDGAGRVCGVGNSRRTGTNGVGHPGTKLGTLDPITLGNVLGGKDVVVGCVDALGVPLWWRAVGGIADDVGVAAAIDGHGDLVIVGTSGVGAAGKADFGTGAVAGDSTVDVFAARYATATGAVVDVGVWPAIESTNSLSDVVVDPVNGDVLLAGHSTGPMDFGDTLAGDGKAGNYGVFLTSLGNGPFDSTYLPINCDALHTSYASLGSGVYPVDPDGPYGADAFYARCDMTTAGGGWTRIATMMGNGGICNMTQPLSAWTYADLESAGPAVHGWLSAATVAPMFVKEEVRLVANVGPEWIFRAPASSAGWTWPNIANGTVNGGNMAATGVTASKNGTVYNAVSDWTSAFLLGGMVGTEYTSHLGGGRAGHANGLFDQTTQCPQPPYFGIAIDAAPLPGVAFGTGGAVWVR